jgi:hypothetical protein
MIFSSRLSEYLELEKELFRLRDNQPSGSPGEDLILDRMDEVWWSLTADEISWLNGRPNTHFTER